MRAHRAAMTVDGFRALCEANALFVATDVIDLITAVDRLEQIACGYGLITRVGQDEVTG